MAKVLLLSQRTAFCRFAAQEMRKRFGGRLQHEEMGAEGRRAIGGDEPAILIWGNGRSHHRSNILNIPGSRKLVFDKHPDGACSLRGLDYDNHNDASVKEGVAVIVCHAIENSRARFIRFEGREESNLLHVSIDLDFVEGFPALPYMSTGSTDIHVLCGYLEKVLEGKNLMRFDIGGYSEMTGDFQDVYSRYL